MGCLYKIDFPSGKSYIGISSTTAKDRWRRHSTARSPTTLVGRAFKKYGLKDPVLSVLVIASSWDYLCDLEKKAIVAFGTKMPNGYNMTDGGEGMLGHEWSQESRDKLSATSKGVAKSQQAIDNMSAAQKGVPKNWTPSWKENVRAALIGKTWSLGLKRSDETKAKQSKRKVSWWNSLSKKERSDFIKARSDAQRNKGNFKEAAEGCKNWWASMSADERKEFCDRRAKIQAEKKR